MSTALEVLMRRLAEDAALCEEEARRLEARDDHRGAAWWAGRAADFQRMASHAAREREAVREIRHG